MTSPATPYMLVAHSAGYGNRLMLRHRTPHGRQSLTPSRRSPSALSPLAPAERSWWARGNRTAPATPTTAWAYSAQPTAEQLGRPFHRPTAALVLSEGWASAPSPSTA